MLLRWIRRFLYRLFLAPRRIRWSVVFEEILTLHTEGDLKMKLSTEQQVKLTVRPLTASGRPARIDGPVRFVTEDDTIVAIETIDANTAYAKAVGPGTARVFATFDADLDADEIRLLEFDAEIEVVEAEATGAELSFGTPEFLVLTPPGEPEVVEPVQLEGLDMPPVTPADPEAPVDPVSPEEPKPEQPTP